MFLSRFDCEIKKILALNTIKNCIPVIYLYYCVGFMVKSISLILKN